MAEPRQPQLNGAYYGPSIPPPKNSKSYHRPGRGSSCNPLGCCCGCLCNCLWGCICQILISIIVAVAIIGVILFLIFRPNKVKFYATDAELTQFEFSTANNTLYYNLAVNMTIRNPNRRIGIYYDSIEARALYEGQRFHSVMLDPFYQGRKNTSELHPVFSGQHIVPLGSKEISNYNNDRSSNLYNIEVKLYLRIRLKLGWVKSPRIKPKIECDLQIPLDSNGRSSGTFQTKRCGLDW
ncbi:hypothetical protein M9H77_00859 [Catharanthus roseus]|uniref:Uncharacterized protein n=1 Tax=Catharanthus roseus TaxID=4058 RepID=A0ACC0C470_CATRO|nr:hypothetical protein M9H77_00859 [Catharanthus roseus]